MTMSETEGSMGFPEAARRLGVPLRVLRQAIRAGRLEKPPVGSATAHVPAAWLAAAQARVESERGVFSRALTQKVPAFARYEGTSAWRKYRAKVRAFYTK